MTRAQHGGCLVNVDGELLRVSVDGHADAGLAPVVVFCNGLGMISDYWDPVVTRLPDLTCVRFDRPGTGGSPRSALPSLDLSDEVRRVLACTDAVVAGSPKLIVVGHSYGGILAEGVARLNPERAAGLVLVDPSDPADYANPHAHGHLSLLHRVIDTAVPPAVERAAGIWFEQLVTFMTTAGPGHRLHGHQRRHYGRPGNLRATLAEDSRLPRHCAQLLDAAGPQPLPDIPVHLLAAEVGGRPFGRPQPGWVGQLRARTSVLGPRVEFQVVRSAHLVMFDAPQAVSDAITACTQGEPAAPAS